MTQNRILTIDCLFLHDTQMSDLQKEQSILRKLYAGREAVPFNFAPPFCPIRTRLELGGKLRVDAPIAVNGWIIRPVPALRQIDTGETPKGENNDSSQFPGFSPIPHAIGFILGYAGSEAERILADFSASPHTGQFQVRVWYFAAMTFSIEHEPGKFYRCEYETGVRAWKKA